MANYTELLLNELVPAMGCTEPIAIALCAAKAKMLLGTTAEHMEVYCSSNVIKNARSVTVPGSRGLCGIAAAAALGCFGGNSNLDLEVLSKLNDEQIALAQNFVLAGNVEILHAKNVAKLYIRVCMHGEGHSSEACIAELHNRFIYMSKDDEILLNIAQEVPENQEEAEISLKLEDILEYIEGLDFDKEQALATIIDRQIEDNLRISVEGLNNNYGAMVGKTILHKASNSINERMCAHAAAGSDARMAGCALPVVINSGSGNQGMTVSLPIILYAQENNLNQDMLRRALVLSNLLAIQIKKQIGRLSAFCGVVSAAAAAGAGLAWLEKMSIEQIGQVLSIALLTSGGILCDGAKASCASKIAVSVNSALLALDMVRDKHILPEGQGLAGRDVDDTIRNIALIAREGMEQTDEKILTTLLKDCPNKSTPPLKYNKGMS